MLKGCLTGIRGNLICLPISSSMKLSAAQESILNFEHHDKEAGEVHFLKGMEQWACSLYQRYFGDKIDCNVLFYHKEPLLPPT